MLLGWGATMYFLEGPHEDMLKREYEEKRAQFMEQTLENELKADMNEKEKTTLLKKCLDNAVELVRMDPGEKQWSYIRSVGFAAETSSTIGFGVMAPSTEAGKIATILFAIVLIPNNIYYNYVLGLCKY